MKILYIDNRDYGHNADLHIDFISHMHKNNIHRIMGYGRYMHKYLPKSTNPNRAAVTKELDHIASRMKPDIILTYNCNGSSYEIGLDNVHRYQWVEDFLSKTSIPKFHVTTDYCRSGFRQSQADWFKDLGYTAAFFRHKIALENPLEIDGHWLPFSIDRKLYKNNIIKDVKAKNFKVGFLGAAHNSSKELYAHRIAAMDFLEKRKMLQVSKITNRRKFRREILTGEKFVRFYTANQFGLACGGTCNFMTAKYFQIPASYSMLVGVPTNGSEILPEGTFIPYSKDRGDLKRMHREIYYHVRNPDLLRDKIHTAHKYVMAKHNHDRRAKEFTGLIRRYI